MNQVTEALPKLDQSWMHAIEAVAENPGVAMALGASDSGKTTWILSAARQLVRDGKLPSAIVDADIGQSTIGPPTTVGLCLVRGTDVPDLSFDSLECHAFSFVGAVSPIGHLLQTVVATKRLVEKALQTGAKAVLVDTTGLIGESVGFQLKLRKIDLVSPKHLVVLQRESELEMLLSVLRERPGLQIHRLEVSLFARPRSQTERSSYRTDRFAAYFAKAKTVALESSRLCILSPPTGLGSLPTLSMSPLILPQMLRLEALNGLLLGLNDSANDTLGLGLLEGVSDAGQEVRVLTPVRDTASVRILQIGSSRLNQAGQELPGYATAAARSLLSLMRMKSGRI